MIAIKPLVLLALFFIQGIQSYCVYNEFTDGTKFQVVQKDPSPYRKFWKYMEPGTKECCPYSTVDCSSLQIRNQEANFMILFDDENTPSTFFGRRYLKCTTGGGLVIGGTKDNFYGSCLDAKGVSSDALLPNITAEEIKNKKE